MCELNNATFEQGKLKYITDNNRSFTYNFTLNFLALKR